jgi:carbonic anhydrase
VAVAGNVVGPYALASLEYGTGHLKTPLLLIMGHSSCGAVTAVVKHQHVHGSIPQLLDLIAPALDRAQAEHPGASDDDMVAATVRMNVLLNIERTIRGSDVIRGLIKAGNMRVEGAVCDIDSGIVTFLGCHPDQAAILEE